MPTPEPKGMLRVKGGWADRALVLSAFVFTILPIAIMMVGGAVFGVEKPAWWTWFPQTSWGLAVVSGLVSAVRASRRATPTAASVRVDGDVLVVTRDGGELRIPKHEIRAAVVVPSEKGVVARIEIGGGESLSFETPSVEEAEAIVAAAGIEPERVRFEPVLAGGLGRALALGGVGAASLVLFANLWKSKQVPAPYNGLIWLAATIAVLAAWWYGMRPPRVAVGADGVSIRKRFVPYAEIANVRALEPSDFKQTVRPRQKPALGPSTPTLELALAAGEVIRVELADKDDLRALVARIRMGMAAAASEPDAAARRALLVREGKSLADWRASLLDLTRESVVYRRAALTIDELGRILESARASAEERLGAALALRSLGGEEGQKKIRIAAEACADPRIRIGLEGAAEGDDEAVEEALAEEEKRTGG